MAIRSTNFECWGSRKFTRVSAYSSQVYIDVRMKRRLRATAGFIFGAVATRAVGAKQRIKSDLESFQRPLFVKAHFVDVGDGFDVGSAASVRKL